MYLTQGLHRALQQHPDRLATIDADRTRTYAQSAQRIAKLASALRTIGVNRGDRVGMLALNSDRYHEYLLAVPWADAVLNPINIRWSPPEIAYALRDSQTDVLFVDDAFSPAVPALRASYPDLRAIVHCGNAPTPEGMFCYEELIAGGEVGDDVRRSGDQLAGVFYTGGTTGLPKGVMLSHANLMTSVLGMLSVGSFLSSEARLLHVAPLFHLADLAAWAGQTTLGGTHVMLSTFEPSAILQTIERHQVTDVLLVPTMLQMVVDHPAVRDYDLSSLRNVMYGASPISEAVLSRAMKTVRSARFMQGYGMTELSPLATVLRPEDHEHPDLLRSAGRAAPCAEVKIVDADDKEVPPGNTGEIVVRGGNVMLGYWNKPDETAAALRNGWMHTGDAGYMDERGYVFVVDRIKDMIISGGENVYSTEVENVLSRHPAVAACAVIGVADENWGERVHAVVVLTENSSVTAEELRDFCKTQIAGYKAPRTASFVDALPLSGAGKVLKRELRKQFRQECTSTSRGR
ncbi:long-chain fatty acid--CoA ligase [Mycobacterium avium subsp. hominissuis]|uniref:acyl-CoA synthetase n=1 Tax=Mycobacterium avium TaxID=1764 RepID=UPI001CC6EF9E|nr:long-chain fatty acid--CoA ligase [Mycobacterium avium]MBZ4512183.1 long-chain fatty acid--CoA ligase [Mycobacterium avium subsp. hominissuis]